MNNEIVINLNKKQIHEAINLVKGIEDENLRRGLIKQIKKLKNTDSVQKLVKILLENEQVEIFTRIFVFYDECEKYLKNWFDGDYSGIVSDVSILSGYNVDTNNSDYKKILAISVSNDKKKEFEKKHQRHKEMYNEYVSALKKIRKELDQ